MSSPKFSVGNLNILRPPTSLGGSVSKAKGRNFGDDTPINILNHFIELMLNEHYPLCVSVPLWQTIQAKIVSSKYAHNACFTK